MNKFKELIKSPKYYITGIMRTATKYKNNIQDTSLSNNNNFYLPAPLQIFKTVRNH